MNYAHILENMKSVRDYKRSPAAQDKIQAVLAFGKKTELPFPGDLSIHLIQNGAAFFKAMDQKVGYFGKMIEAPHYIAVTGIPTKETAINAGYVTELMRFESKQQGLGTCWLHTETTQENSAELILQPDEKILGLFAIGEPYSGFFKQDIQKKAARDAVVDLVYQDHWGEEVTWETLDQRGISEALHLARMAPSWGNLQPWRFLLYEDKLAIAIKPEKQRDFYTETGILMAYVEKAFLAHGIRSTGHKEADCAALAKEAAVADGYEIRALYQI